MPTITISDETFAHLRALAEPLVDTPDTVIARLVAAYRPLETGVSAMSERNSVRVRTLGNSSRARRGEVTPRSVYRKTLLQVLQAAGGQLETKQAINLVGARLKNEFTSMDLANLPTGEERWVNAVHFARKDLIDSGELDTDSPHGVWRLSS